MLGFDGEGDAGVGDGTQASRTGRPARRNCLQFFFVGGGEVRLAPGDTGEGDCGRLRGERRASSLCEILLDLVG